MTTPVDGIYMATLPWHGKGANPNPNQEYSLEFNSDTEHGTPAFHEPNDDDFWGREYVPITHRLCESANDIAGAESGPSLAAVLPPGIGLVPKNGKPPR